MDFEIKECFFILQQIVYPIIACKTYAGIHAACLAADCRLMPAFSRPLQFVTGIDTAKNLDFGEDFAIICKSSSRDVFPAGADKGIQRTSKRPAGRQDRKKCTSN
jgi:hypothetical protein